MAYLDNLSTSFLYQKRNDFLKSCKISYLSLALCYTLLQEIKVLGAKDNEAPKMTTTKAILRGVHLKFTYYNFGVCSCIIKKTDLN